MRAGLKRIALTVSAILVVPALVSFAIRSSIIGRNEAIAGSSQAFALIPGLVGDYLRRAFLARTLKRCDRSASIGFGTVFSKTAASIAEDVVIGSRCQVGWATIERGVLIGPACHLLSGARTHGIGDASVPVRDQASEFTEIRIGAGAWIGSASIVMNDVGEGSVVAAGSVVYDAIPPNVIAGGIPARVIKRRGSATVPSEALVPSVASSPAALPMTNDFIRSGVAQTISHFNKGAVEPIEWSQWASDYGIDSLSLLLFRELLERRFDVHIPDPTWLGFTSFDEVVSYIADAAPRRTPAAPSPESPAAGAGFGSGARLTDGCLIDTLEVGMPMTGLNNLAENPLLKYLGHLRWAHLSAVCGIRSRDIVDAEGHRLYPTFFFVDLQFPQARHMATFTENERLNVVCTLQRFGGSMLDGYSYLVPEELANGDPPKFKGIADAVAAGFPTARLSNIFVKQFGGAEWLKKSRPVSDAFDRVQQASEPPDSYALVKAAERDGYFERPGGGFTPLTEGPVTVDYRLVPERDLNGAGLVYFANYPLFLDIGERQALKLGRFPLTDALLDKRSIVRRRSAYLNNAASGDTVAIEIEAWLRNPTSVDGKAPEAAPIVLFLNYRMRRVSDGRIMMVSSAEKRVSGRTLADLPFADEFLKEYSKQ